MRSNRIEGTALLHYALNNQRLAKLYLGILLLARNYGTLIQVSACTESNCGAIGVCSAFPPHTVRGSLKPALPSTLPLPIPPSPPISGHPCASMYAEKSLMALS